MSFSRHLLAFGALIVNLWIGGDLVEQWTSHYVRGAFEMALILAYLAWVVRVRIPLGRRRPPGTP